MQDRQQMHLRQSRFCPRLTSRTFILQDNGKPIFYSRAADIPLSIDHFRYFAGWADKIHGKTIPVDGPYMAYTMHEPIGVVGQVRAGTYS